jgi:endo-1,4-beta-xylanase
VSAFDPARAPQFAALVDEQPQTITLRNLAESRKLWLGAAAQTSGLSDPIYTSLLARQFNMLAVENAMKWESTQPDRGRFDFTQGDLLVAFARANRMAVYAHALVWDTQLPEWLTQGSFTRQEMIQILCTHIKTVVGYYRGQVYAWVVVNEPFDNRGVLRPHIFLQAIGPEYIAMAFQWAHEADPNAILVLNEHQSEGMNTKSQAVYALASGLIERGIPVQAVGLQMHIVLHGQPSQENLLENMQRLGELGLEVHISEMDVRTQYSSEPLPEKLKRQALHYRQVMQACLQVSACRVFATWGVSDRYSWIPWWTGRPDYPLLFDEQGQPKPAYDALIEELIHLSKSVGE